MKYRRFVSDKIVDRWHWLRCSYSQFASSGQLNNEQLLLDLTKCCHTQLPMYVRKCVQSRVSLFQAES